MSVFKNNTQQLTFVYLYYSTLWLIQEKYIDISKVFQYTI